MAAFSMMPILTATLSISWAVSDASCILVADASSTQTLRIESWGHNAVRVRAVPAVGANAHFFDAPDVVSALVEPASAPCVAKNAPASLVQGNLNTSVGADGRITMTRISDGVVLLNELRTRTFGASRNVATTSTSSTGTPVAALDFHSLGLSFEAWEDERVYGLGQHKNGALNYKNETMRTFSLSPANTEILIPVYHSSRGYAFLLNLPGFGSVELGDNETAWNVDAVLQADFWLATTSAADSTAADSSPWAQLQYAYADATGHAPVYPEWTSGFWQCKNRYRNQTQVLDIAQGYVDRDYPISLIIIDYKVFIFIFGYYN